MMDVFRMMGEGRSTEEIAQAYASAKEELEAQRRAQFAGLGAPDDCLWPATHVFHQHSRITSTWWPLITNDEAEALTMSLDYKRYPNAPRVPLPAPSPLSAKLADCLRGRTSTRAFSSTPMTLEHLATFLESGCGITHVDSLPRRAQPSGGGLYPVETYPLVFSIEGLAPGVYHYAPLEHAVELVHPIAGRESVKMALPAALYEGSPAVAFVMTIVFARTQSKYMERGYRFAMLEAGHIAQNFTLLAEAQGLGSVCFGGFYDDDLNKLLELDPDREAAVYGVLAGHPREDP